MLSDASFEPLARNLQALGMVPPETSPGLLPGNLREKERDRTQARRRGFQLRPEDDPIGTVTLVNVDGVLTWQEGLVATQLPSSVPESPAIASPRRRWGSTASQKAVVSLKYEKLGASQVGAFLETLDAQLTPNQGWLELDKTSLKLVAKTASGPVATGRILLIVHGTFSESQAIVGQFQSTQFGQTFLGDAAKKYDQILALNHPTLSVSPIINALQIARFFAHSSAEVDVISHSRGGLVTRWWIEGFGGNALVRNAIFVASPLAGTGLAAPPQFRHALEMLSNIGNIVGGITAAASIGLPFLTVAAGLIKLVSSFGSLTAKTPLIDAAVAMVPGFVCQSRVLNNVEVNQLRIGNNFLKDASQPSRTAYHAITGSFMPNPVGLRIWELFVRVDKRIAAAGASCIFYGKNDLVVDSVSMTQLFGPPLSGDLESAENFDVSVLHTFDDSNSVYHTNYFEQPETIRALSQCLFRA
jgi:hypothetical protein